MQELKTARKQAIETPGLLADTSQFMAFKLLGDETRDRYGKKEAYRAAGWD